jgi:hypothetical protein
MTVNTEVDRYVKVTRRFDSGKKPYYQITIFSENPKDDFSHRVHKGFDLTYETSSKTQAELYAYKLAEHLECRVWE